ncbi:hypothetical protein, partial [Leclercia adecarboxylata]|uniref:hypothetical protein n=1 Tax=Leclercia adecarboxylata TaxID=83655 RepID=UPI00234D13DB
IDTLRSDGHAKWQSVDLTDIPPGWDISTCVNRGIDPEYVPSCTPVAPEAETPTDSEANAAYRRNLCAVLGCWSGRRRHRPVRCRAGRTVGAQGRDPPPCNGLFDQGSCQVGVDLFDLLRSFDVEFHAVLH